MRSLSLDFDEGLNEELSDFLGDCGLLSLDLDLKGLVCVSSECISNIGYTFRSSSDDIIILKSLFCQLLDPLGVYSRNDVLDYSLCKETHNSLSL